MIPEAKICHFTTGRLRFKISAHRNDHQFFLSIQEKFRKAGYAQTVVNPLTGSIIIESKDLSVDEITLFGRKKRLFAIEIIEKKQSDSEALLQKVTTPLSGINADLKKISGGDIDLPIAIFILLLAFGVIEILRGNFKMPPWYTAFWYAFGVFSKAIFDSRQTNKN
ncbi:MAG: hypothetical protein R6U27_13855 [Desulfobacterales bacterium]